MNVDILNYISKQVDRKRSAIIYVRSVFALTSCIVRMYCQLTLKRVLFSLSLSLPLHIRYFFQFISRPQYYAYVSIELARFFSSIQSNFVTAESLRVLLHSTVCDFKASNDNELLSMMFRIGMGEWLLNDDDDDERARARTYTNTFTNTINAKLNFVSFAYE